MTESLHPALDRISAISAIGARGPRIRELSPRQMECILLRNNVGRIAFCTGVRLELFPIHYVFAHGAVYGRTSFGAKSVGWSRNPNVVLEVDESDGLFDWRSVIVRGKLSLLRSSGVGAEPFAYLNALAAIRTLIPEAFTERDPVPARGALFRVVPTEMSGREAVSR